MAEIRETGGDEGILDGVHMLILHTIGAKSGQPRQNPLVYQPATNNGGEIYIFASNAGQDRNSGWYYNILAHPDEVSVEIGGSRHPVTVRVLTGDERDRIYGHQADRIKNFADYQKKTTRVIPVLGLTRTG